MKALPSLQNLWNEHGGKGLHMFLLSSQGHSAEELKTFLGARGITAPVFVGGMEGYPGDNGLPFTYVIGVDGTVVFEGRGNYEAVVKAELAKIKYPGLGKIEVNKALEKAAQSFVKKEYAKAAEEARKVAEKKADDAAVKADADHIVARCDKAFERLRSQADEAKADKRYPECFAALEAISAGFKGEERAETAATELKDLKKDKDVQKEVKAWDGLAKVVEANKKVQKGSDRAKALRDFAKKNEGTRAALEAGKLADEAEAATAK